MTVAHDGGKGRLLMLARMGGEASKAFFSEEKNQKTFRSQVFVPPGRAATASRESLLVPP